MAAPIQDFGRVLSTLFRFVRTASYALIGVMLVFMAFRVAEVYRFFADMHPWLGVAFLLALGVLLYLLVGRPIYSFLKVPAALKPPTLPPMADRTGRHLSKHLLFMERYLGSLLTNPEWEGTKSDVDDAVARCRALREKTTGAGREEVAELSGRIRSLEQETVSRLLEPLDRKARQVIRQEALAVGIATAVSWNGTLDAFIVLWRNCNLVSRIARIYYGRPGARGTLSIVRDVSVAVMAGAYLQDLTEAAGSAMGGLFGKTVGALGGPLLDGGLNAVATLRIAYVAKARCRSFNTWNERTRTEAVRTGFAEAATFSKEVVTEVVKTVGGGILKVPAKALGRIGESLANIFRKPDGPDGEPSPAGA